MTDPPGQSPRTPRPGGIRTLCHGILQLRLIAAALTTPALLEAGGQIAPAFAAVALAMLGSLLPLLFWHRVADVLLRHPALLAVDVGVTGLVLTLAGVHSPFLLVTLGSAALGGLLYGRVGAAVFSGLLLAVYWLALLDDPAAGQATFQALVGTPLLYPLIAASAAGVRGLLERQARTEQALALAVRRAGAADERARLAREMHDSLGKTLEGIRMAAAGLARRAAGSASADVAAAAEGLALAAGTATGEARALIGGLRAEPLDDSLAAGVERLSREWADRTGHRLDLTVEPTVKVSDRGRRQELLAILDEALRNTERHARAAAVEVALLAGAEAATLTVADDGVGFVLCPERLARDGHYGVVGMHERAALAGACLRIDTAPGSGTRVEARFATEVLPVGRAAAQPQVVP